MKNILITVGVQVLAACTGLLLSLWWVPGFDIQTPGFIVAVLVVVLAQAAFTPLAARAARRYAPAFMGGTGLIAALLALVIAGLFPGGVSVSGLADWVLSALILWVTSAGGWGGPLLGPARMPRGGPPRGGATASVS
ncbi:hypothetical protein LJ753_00880 [Arthrobacter sp. zg-Y20]|uniref:hypothetical protein n=1 Tax=unclassified Arthrobacter TaxID=235627 RepID=UPI001D154035|nr:MULTISPECIES: hypothetical protein [unclassified Arthrobacter]MCC3274428.1 hypothetical protein [Arthrobacter sp. zg-Y20]MDK1314584.1 hypothetical protein [Arthrobacter sp. zg.Y20]